MNNKRIIVTGAAGFIGANLCMELFRKNEGVHVIGIDNMNDYYDVSIKEWRLAEVEKFAAESAGSTWTFHRCNIADKTKIDAIFAEHKPDIVINLAAQAGVRYSITNPDAYIESNLVGFYNILGKFSAIIGPALVGIVTQLTGESTKGAASLAVLFAVGLLIFLRLPAPSD